MIKIHEILKSTITDFSTQYCVNERGEVYYMAYETNMEKPISVLWSNLEWLRRSFGVDRMNGVSPASVKSNITKASLNFSRSKNIADMKFCIEEKVHLRALEYLEPDGSYGMVRNPAYGHIIDGKMSLTKEIPRTPEALTKSTKAYYEADIAKGLYVICKYV